MTLDASLQAESAQSARAIPEGTCQGTLRAEEDAALADYNYGQVVRRLPRRRIWRVVRPIFIRGIVLFRRKDFARAEEEFASALNFVMTDALLPRAPAPWRHLSRR